MTADPISLVPQWLITGTLVGIVATVAVAVIFLVGERYLGNPGDASTGVDGNSRRHAEIREYLREIEEPFDESRLVNEFQVEFLLTERDVAITFDPQVYFGLESTGLHLILCEYEMPAAQLGRRLPFEVPKHDSVSSAPLINDAVTDAFAELGLPQSADEAAVKEAYRAEVKQVHPDQGGDEDQFRRLQEAYATARDHCQQRRAA